MGFDVQGQLRHLIECAVEHAITARAYDSAAVLLSGGIDSSTIAHFAEDLPAYTGWYQGEPYDERPFARIATQGGSGAGSRDHREVEITPQDFVDNFDAMLSCLTPPIEGPGTFGQYMVAKRVAADGVKLLLSGEGGDELFGGYARVMIVAGYDPPEGYEDYVLPEDYPRTLDEALTWEWEVNLPALLRVDEQVTRAHGVSAVAPMMDPRVTEFVLQLDPQLRVGKRLLKDTMRGFLPDVIVNRTDKRGFPVPYVLWAQEEPVRSFIADRIGYVPDVSKPSGPQVVV